MPYTRKYFKPLIYTFAIVLSLCKLSFAQKKEKEQSIVGIATWYSNSFHGRKTASGEIFSQKRFTCATNRFKIGTWLRVENISNGKTVIVKVNDRMAPHPRRVIDLSKIAAEKLGIIGRGMAKVRIENLGRKKPSELPEGKE